MRKIDSANDLIVVGKENRQQVLIKRNNE